MGRSVRLNLHEKLQRGHGDWISMKYGIIGTQLVMVIACLNIAGCGLMVDRGAGEHELESFVMIRNLG